ncbi:MAG: hypothetical protein PUD22_08115 [Erysipelotrichaceae bacterium]|nr:hypothetical protein [Erysipelotrichaceae bacterium]
MEIIKAGSDKGKKLFDLERDNDYPISNQTVLRPSERDLSLDDEYHCLKVFQRLILIAHSHQILLVRCFKKALQESIILCKHPLNVACDYLICFFRKVIPPQS